MNELINGIKDAGNDAYVSFALETKDDKKKIYNMITNPDKSFKEMVGKRIKIKDVFCDTFKYTNKETGEVKNKVRIIVCDEDGVSYITTSYGVYLSMKEMFLIYGTPDLWDEPLEVEVTQTVDGNRNYLKISVV